MFSVHAIGTVKCPVSEMSRGNWATVDSEISSIRDVQMPQWVGRVMEGYF